MIKNVKHLVEVIGGNVMAADYFKVSVPAICNWKKENRLPAWSIPIAAEAAAKMNMELPPKLAKTRRPQRPAA